MTGSLYTEDRHDLLQHPGQQPQAGLSQDDFPLGLEVTPKTPSFLTFWGIEMWLIPDLEKQLLSVTLRPGLLLPIATPRKG